MIEKIPFMPLGAKTLKRVSRHYLGWGENLSKIFPSLEWELEQARFGFEPREWAAVAFFSMLNYFFAVFGALFILLLFLRVFVMLAFAVSILVALGIGMGVFMFQIFYPKLFIGRKIKELEKNLPFVLHHMLIHIRSGVPLFSALVSVSKANYGLLSKEFERVVNEITTGMSEIGGLEMIARENPSIFFRRVIWQLVNSLKSGADIGSTLKEIVDNLMNEQRVAIRKYGAELNPLALFYMILVVIFPTLGIIFLLVLFSFVGTAFNIHLIMIGILGFLVVFQFLFIGMIKTKRPSMI